MVNFIVCAIDDILQTDFAVARGLADKIQLPCWILPCAGTFLLEAIKNFGQQILAKTDLGMRDALIKEHIL